MADTFELEVATPERLIVRERVREAQIPAENGYIGVLPGHAPLLSKLTTGDMSFVTDNDGRRHHLAIHGGFVEVLPEHVRVLADLGERAEEIDVARAQEALKRAQQRLANPSLGVDVARALYAMHRAEARIAAAANK
jgi:F-type H+-transporting ATPase subunit epsilon